MCYMYISCLQIDWALLSGNIFPDQILVENLQSYKAVSDIQL